MNTEDVLLMSANATVQAWNEPDESVGDFGKLIQYSVDLDGRELLEELHDGDRPGLLWPTDVWADGKWRDGSVLFLPDRIVIVWRVGMFRMKHFRRVIPHTSLGTPPVQSEDFAGGRPRTIYTLNEPSSTKFRLWKLTGLLSPMVVENFITGAMTVSVDDDEESS